MVAIVTYITVIIIAIAKKSSAKSMYIPYTESWL